MNSFRSSETGNNLEKRDEAMSKEMNELIKQGFQNIEDLLKCIVTSRHRKSFAGPQTKEIHEKQRDFRQSKSCQQVEERKRTILFDQVARGERQRESNYAIYLRESTAKGEEDL